MVWEELWAKWPDREVFASPEYVLLNAAPHERALCAVGEAEGSHVIYPFLLRALGDVPYCEYALRDFTDIATPYGYGGPFSWGVAWNAEKISAFWHEFDSWATRTSIVSEVVRLSLFPNSLAEYSGERRVVSDNVVCSLKSEELLWHEFEHKVRKNVNRARSSGVRVVVDEDGKYFESFLAIYVDTMDRRNARQNYYFPREYFERIHSELKGQFAYFHAFVGETIVSTELVLVSAKRIYSFLGGTDAEWFHLRPNDLLKLEIMNWAFSAGKTDYVLGGGYTRGDGIYKYKLSFAPEGSVPFSIGSRILSSDAYAQLVDARRVFEVAKGCDWQPNPEYFPAYRG